MKQITIFSFLTACLLFSCQNSQSQEPSITGKWTAFLKYEDQIIETNTHLIFEKDSVAWEINKINGKEERRYFVKDQTIYLYDVDWDVKTEITILEHKSDYLKLDMLGMVLEFKKK